MGRKEKCEESSGSQEGTTLFPLCSTLMEASASEMAMVTFARTFVPACTLKRLIAAEEKISHEKQARSCMAEGSGTCNIEHTSRRGLDADVFGAGAAFG